MGVGEIGTRSQAREIGTGVLSRAIVANQYLHEATAFRTEVQLHGPRAIPCVGQLRDELFSARQGLEGSHLNGEPLGAVALDRGACDRPVRYRGEPG